MRMTIVWICAFIISASSLTLDISKETNELIVSRIGYERGDLEYNIYIAHFTTVVDEIFDGPSLVWKGTDGQKFSKLTIYHLYGEKMIAYLQISEHFDKHFLYLKYKNNEWIIISHREYCDLLVDVLFSRKFIINGTMDNEAFYVCKYCMFGLPAEIYISEGKYDITSVVEKLNVEEGEGKRTSKRGHRRICHAGEQCTTIWKAKEGEKCTFVVIHGSFKDPKLVHLFVRNGQDYKILYFYKHREEWIEVIKERFYRRLELMDEMVTSASRQPSREQWRT